MKPDKPPFWERVFAANDSALKGFLRRRIAHSWDVQDLAQEVYARLLRVDGDTLIDPQAYLFTVASNLLKEHAMLRRRQAMGVDIAQVWPELEAPLGSAEEGAQREFQKERVAAMLDQLPPRCKAVLLMQHRDEMSYQQIAEQFGVSSHMVKKYVVKALTLCRKGLAGYE